ncbi:hypothetical protein FH508_0013210 [Lysinibacillus sp. CD3-6]|uniref:hypothetical protein n=1 Tax=Lysinibacillus sp. CD3-6 TaxID=2892541 RepID=UPI00116E790F|nr:hypothetical protein [Lysinibacillus sp. CD3-6]UED78424.1 hypothetical protein FH508_0013210 [Lysinibacillus sp. CD3-6]
MKLTREQRKQKKQSEIERLKRPQYNRKKEERKNELIEKYLDAVIGKKDAAEKIDSLLYYERNLIYLSQNANKFRKISIGIIIFEIIIFLYLIMQTSFTDLSEKAVVIAGYTALVAITMPILQNMLNKSNNVYEKKIEFFLLTISELLVEDKKFENSEDRKRYEEVLSKIHRMDYPKDIKKEDFEIQKRKNMQDELMKEIWENKK